MPELDNEDEKVLQSLASEEGIQHRDLHRLQISAPPVDKAGRDSATRHRFVNSRQAHICPYCRTLLRTKYSLQMHISVKHFNNRPFKCEECDKTFACNADLTKHIKTHQRQPVQKCDECGKEFRTGYMRRHKKLAHSQPVLSQCNNCDKTFKSKQAMLRHKRLKHEEKI